MRISSCAAGCAFLLFDGFIQGGFRMKKNPHRFSRLELRYFASYLAIMLIVMIALVGFSYRSFSDFHSRILLNGYQASLHLVENAQEEMVTSLISIAGQMTNNDITPVKYAQDPVKASRISGKLNAYRAVTDTVSDIFLHFTGDDYVYSSTSFFLVDRFVSGALLLENTSPADFRDALENTSFLTVWPSQKVEGYAVRHDTTDNYMSLIFVPLSYPGGARVGTVVYLIDEETLFDAFDQYGLGDADVISLFKGVPVMTQNRSGVDPARILTAVQQGESTLREGGKTYHILHEEGSGHFSCVALVSNAEFSVALSGSVKALIFISALAAAAAVLLSTRFVQSRMKGIKLLQSMLDQHAPTGDELIEIRDGIQRLIDENASMSNRLETMQDAQKSEFVRRFLLGSFSDADDFLQTAESVSVNVDTRYFAVAIIAKATESSYELTTEKIDRLFDETVSGASLTPVSADNHLILIAFCNDPEHLRAFLESKFAGLKACSTSITMGVSHFHTGYAEGQRAYLEAENAFEMRFVRGSDCPIFFDALDVQPSSDTGFSHQAVDHLRQALRKGDEARMETALKEVAQAMHSTQSSLFGFRYMYSEIITAISLEGRSSGVNEAELVDLFRLSRCLSIDELNGILSQVCRKIIASQASPQPADIPEAVRKAREIIQHRFSEPELTVSGIAEAVGMSDSKLSLEFKRVYQETPLECITFSRMHRAQRLLSTTEMPVRDIATECGYYDISAFNRRFKSYTGFTPQQFRRQSEEGTLPPEQS